MNFIAKTFAGLENVLAQELIQLGASEVTEIRRAVSFSGDYALMLRVAYNSRLTLRLLMPLSSFEATSEQDLYEGVGKIDFTQYITTSHTIAVDAVVRSRTFTHSQYVALKVKDAVVDQFRDKFGSRPSVDVAQPDLLINVHINENEVNISLDVVGGSLHRRGYRVSSTAAPMSEVLGAGIIALIGWTPEQPLSDPMCGSGTLPIEAAMMATNTPPQYRRPFFSFTQWNDFDKTLWEDIKKEINAQITDTKVLINASDINSFALRTAEQNAKSIGVSANIKFARKDFFQTRHSPQDGILVSNPPYNERLELDDAIGFYKKIGDALKQHWKGNQAYLLSGNLEAAKHIGLRTSRKIPLFNGAIECRLLKFDLF